MDGSLRAYARHRAELRLDGASLAAVQKAIASRRISPPKNGKLNFEKADREWAANTTPAHNSRTQRHRPNGSTEAPAAAAPAASPGTQQSPQQGQFSQARALKEGFLAALTQLEFKRKSGELLPRADIINGVGKLITVAQTRLRGIGAKLAPDLAIETDEAKIQAAIDEEIDQALSELSRWSPK